MQAPPPVSSLIQQLATMASNVQSALATAQIDWYWRPAEADWSLTEVICHLRDVEREVHQVRFEAVIAAENSFLPGAAPDDWAEERDYWRQNGQSALDEYLVARQATIKLLSDLPSGMWQRRGRHAFFGPTTMHELLYLVTRHDDIHWEQIKDLLTGQANRQ